jgi:DNA-binding NtrC family response regulator
MLLVVTTDDALLEGLTQLLAASGQRAVPARSLDEAVELARREAPLLLILDRSFLVADASGLLASLPLAPGGALVTFRSTGSPSAPVPMTPSIARTILADIELPLERHRLLALVEHVTSRARKVARPRRAAPPEPPAS